MQAIKEKLYTYVRFFVSPNRCKTASKLLRSFTSMYLYNYCKKNIQLSIELYKYAKLHSSSSRDLQIRICICLNLIIVAYLAAQL